jgi:hypothetical protein
MLDVPFSFFSTPKYWSVEIFPNAPKSSADLTFCVFGKRDIWAAFVFGVVFGVAGAGAGGGETAGAGDGFGELPFAAGAGLPPA